MPSDLTRREWYSLVHGNVLVIMLGTEMEIGPGSDQYVFLNNTLATANRSVTPWIIVLGHRYVPPAGYRRV